MIRQISIRVLMAAAIVLAIAAPAAAQGQSAGVGFLINKWVDLDDTQTQGVHVDYHLPIKNGFGAVMDFSFAAGDDAKDTTFGGGVRFTLPSGAVRPFGQATIGVAHFSLDGGFSDSAFYFAPGGGILVKVAPGVDIKAQIDFLINNGWEFDDGNIFRFIIGANFGFGR